MGCSATKVAPPDQSSAPSAGPAAKHQPNAQSPVAILSTLDDRLVAVLEAGDIRLLRVKWLEVQKEEYTIQRRQELEALQEENEKRGEELTPLLGCKEAADLVRNGEREVGALSYLPSRGPPEGVCIFVRSLSLPPMSPSPPEALQRGCIFVRSLLLPPP